MAGIIRRNQRLENDFKTWLIKNYDSLQSETLNRQMVHSRLVLLIALRGAFRFWILTWLGNRCLDKVSRHWVNLATVLLVAILGFSSKRMQQFKVVPWFLNLVKLSYSTCSIFMMELQIKYLRAVRLVYVFD